MKAKKQEGFSLLEMLVALFVVVIIASLVSLAVNSGGQDIELETRVRSLANISAYAVDEAQMRGVDMGLLIERVNTEGEEVYRFGWRERMPEGWRKPVVDADIFADQQFPFGVELAMELESTVLEDVGSEGLTADGEVAEIVPQVLFYSSGEVTVGFIELRQVATGDVLWRIEWDLLGRFTLLLRGEVPADEEDE